MGRRRSALGGKGLSGVANASLGFYTVWVVHLGRRYGILPWLSRRKGPARTAAIARACGLREPAVRVWCEAARSLGLVARSGGGYGLPAEAKRLLADTEDVRFLGGQFSYLALRSLDFDAFDPLFRKGIVVALGSRHLREASAEATRWDHTSFMKFLLPRMPDLAARLRSGARALDVGCGTGGWVLRMSHAFPRSSFTGIDPDRTAIRMARTMAGERGRVRFRVGTAIEPMRGSSPFDLAYLGEVLYGVTSPLRLLKNVRRSLARDGVLVLAEGLVAPASKSFDGGGQLVAAMGLDFALQGAGFFKKSELGSLLKEAGFHRVRFHDAGGGLWFVAAEPKVRTGGSERGGAARRARGDR